MCVLDIGRTSSSLLNNMFLFSRRICRPLLAYHFHALRCYLVIFFTNFLGLMKTHCSILLAMCPARKMLLGYDDMIFCDIPHADIHPPLRCSVLLLCPHVLDQICTSRCKSYRGLLSLCLFAPFFLLTVPCFNNRYAYNSTEQGRSMARDLKIG